MANATISAPQGTQAGNFNVTATFDVPINDFNKPNVNLIARTENGITGIDFEITGSGTDYNLFFTLPNEVEGSFSIGITGMVTPDGTSTPEGVMANTLVVMYDNTLNVNASFGTVEYRNNGAIAVPITFAESVIVPSKSICEITRVSGDDLVGVNYRIIGENTDFEIIFEVPPDRVGSFSISAVGDVFKRSSGVWDNVVVEDVVVNYSTTVPRIVDFDIQSEFEPGEVFDVKIAFNTIITGIHANNIQDVFILEGAANVMGTPTPYKWTGMQPPNLQEAVPSDLTGTDWQQLAPPPAGNPTPGMNGFDDDGQWHGVSGQFFLVRWMVDANTTGIFNMTLREGMLRGPIGS